MVSLRPARRRRVGLFATVLGGVVGAVALYVGVTLPPAAATLTAPVPPTVVFGAYHIHSTRSDGTGTPDEIARAAARAGLQFVILTDHGDATRAPDAPAYRNGVLVFDAVEITTRAGHLVALGLSEAAPYPLAGDARDVIEDIHRLGGRAVLAHPDSTRGQLGWRAWDTAYDGVEWLNADSEWRDDAALRLAGTSLRALIRAPEAIVSLFDRPAATLGRWDRAASTRSVIALAAVDAHARIPWADDQAPRKRTIVAVPGYETMFRTLAQGVELDTPLTGRAADDASRLLGALVGGRTFSIARAIAGPAALEFTATQGGVTHRMGSRLEGSEEVTFSAHVPLPAARVVLLHDGRPLAAGQGQVRYTGRPRPGSYRVEAQALGRAVPWLLSNPIYAGALAPAGPESAAPPSDSAAPMLSLTGPWRTEQDATSQVSVTRQGEAIALEFTLGPGMPAGQYAAAVTNVGGDRTFSGVRVSARADRPLRVSIQLRLGAGDSRRWQRSVYVDQTSRTFSLSFADFEPVEAPTSLRPNTARVQGVLVVVDTLNLRPGAKGRVELRAIGLY
jgi:hypothetical protein